MTDFVCENSFGESLFYRVFDFVSYLRGLCTGVEASFSILGVDYGTRKIGLSVGKIGDGLAFPKDVLIGDWNNVEDCFSALLKKIEEYKAQAIVIGFPLKMNGEQHDNCKKIIQVAEKLLQHFKEKKVCFPILLFDERFTTQATYAIEKVVSKASQNNKRAGERSFENSKKNNSNSFDDAKSATIMLNEVLGLF